MPWSAVGLMVAWEGGGRGKTSRVGHEKTLRVEVRGSEEEQSVLVAAAAVDRLGLLGVGVEGLHEMVELLAATVGWEAGGQSDFVGVEGLEQRGWSPAEKAGAPVCQGEVVEVQSLLCSPPS